MKKIAIAGASGNLGSAVTARFLESGFAVRGGSRSPEKMPTADNFEAMSLDYEAPESFGPFLKGADLLFVMAPPLDPRAPSLLNPLIDEAARLGLEGVIFSSAMGANVDPAAPLARVEAHLLESGLPWIVLRPNFFMDNFTAGFLKSMVATGNMYLAAGDEATSFIAAHDIARTALYAVKKGLWGNAFDLTGPKSYTHSEIARLLTEHGQQTTYHPIEEEALIQGSLESGMPRPAVEYLATLYRAVRAGHTAMITDNVEKVTGTPPVPFKEFLAL